MVSMEIGTVFPALLLLATASLLLATAETQQQTIGDGRTMMEEFYRRYNGSDDRPIDLVFVLDRSHSVQRKVWISMVNFVRDIVDRFTVDANATRVAMVTYSTTPSVDINHLEPGPATDHVTKCALYRRMSETVDRLDLAGHTATGEALRKAYGVLLDSRPDSKKAVFLITDGRSRVGIPPLRPAMQIRSLNWTRGWDVERDGPQVEIFALGLAAADQNELSIIASPLPHHAVLLADHDTFELFVRSLHEDRQEDRWVRAESPTTGSSQCPYNCSSLVGQGSRCMCGLRLGQYACACGPGFELDGLQCKACPKGKFKDHWSPVPCRSCPENTTTESTGSSRLGDCHLLPGFRRCPALPEVQNSARFYVAGDRQVEMANTGQPCRDWEVTDGNSCHYECDEGYQLTGSPVMVCTSTGRWSGTVPACVVTDCEKLPGDLMHSLRISNITYLNESTTYGSRVQITCPAGSVALGSSQWTCNKHGQWTMPRNFQCKEVFCGRPPSAANVHYVPAECTNRSKLALGEVCRTVCRDGFQLTGPDNHTCSYDGRAAWSPEALPVCNDVQPPSITCPPGVDVTVADWDDVNVTLSADAVGRPLVADNSGDVTYHVTGLSDDRVFGIGHWPVIYDAADAAGNTANCTQYILVKAKNVEIRRCPDDVTLRTNSASRRLVVTWPEPEFVGRDGVPMPFECTKQNGSEFTIGSTHINCYPEGHQQTTCSFVVNITDPVCPIPFRDRAPLHGSLNCTSNDYRFPSICRIRCHEGYELHDPATEQEFRCSWDGRWSTSGPWPECYKTKRPTKASIANTIHAEINGSCTDLKPKLVESFIATVAQLLSNSQGPCSTVLQCRVANIFVTCGEESQPTSALFGSLRPEDDNATSSTMLFTNFTVEFKLEGELKDSSAVTSNLQEELVIGLEENLYDEMQTLVREETFVWPALDSLAVAVKLEGKLLQFGNLNCKPGEILNERNDRAPTCQSCPVGFHQLSNGTECEACPNGFYQDQDGSTDCKSCPDQMNTTFQGARDISECKNPCEPGNFSSTGYEPCGLCPVGTYQDQVRSADCLQCPGGHSTLAVGSSAVEDCLEYCAMDTFSASGLQPCSPCQVGTFQPNNRSTACLSCLFRDELTNQSAYCPVLISCADHNLPCDVSNSRCVMHDGKAQCLCNAGFSGDHCDVNIDDCFGVVCQHGGTCFDETLTYHCNCTDGYTGRHCEIDIDECASSPCQNDGSCLDGVGAYTCACAAGFSADDCEVDINDCQPDPCSGRGQCTDLVNGFNCTCDDGFTGDSCDKEIDRCATITCHNEGHCVARQNSSTVCACSIGYSGQFCEDRIDECASSPCLNNATCISSLGAFLCVCPLGYSGRNCSLQTSVDFDLVFTRPSVTDYAVVKLRSIDLRSITACIWIRTDDMKNYGTVWSYAAESNWLSADDANVFTAYDYANLQLFVNGYVTTTNVSLNNGLWHHLCVTWEGHGGHWQIFVNGSLRSAGNGLAAGTFIQGGGILVLGQEQDVIGGGFNAQESFIGEMSQFVLSDYVLSAEEIAKLAQPTEAGKCRQVEGRVVSWTDMWLGVRGDVQVTNESWCLDVNECKFINFCNRSQQACVDRLGSFDCVPCDRNVCESPTSPCTANPCQHGGSCRLVGNDSYTCACVVGFSGNECQYVIDIGLESCQPETCQNGGRCEKTEGSNVVHCRCVQPWTGRYCQVLSVVTCDFEPCMNNATCVTTPDGYGYSCDCPLAPTGMTATPDCEYVVIPTTTTVAHKYCSNVDCRNGGTCVDLPSTFRCQCHADFKGEYCTDPRDKATNVYHVTVTLEMEFNRRLPYNDTFKQLFIRQVHSVYEKEISPGNSKFLARVTKISKGSVVVEFDLEHTYYLDQSYHGHAALQNIMEKELKTGKLGTLEASMENFKFELISSSDEGHGSIRLAMIIAITVLGLFIFIALIVILVICYRRRYRAQRKPANKVTHPISNPMYHTDYRMQQQQQQPQPSRTRCSSTEESIYCEPREVTPYATSEDSDRDSVGSDFPTGSRQRRPKDWRIRQSIPLPPKPDEASAATAAAGATGPATAPRGASPANSLSAVARSTPPPPYFPTRLSLAPPPTAPRFHSYVNDDASCYFTPISDEEAQLIAGTTPELHAENTAYDGENAYLQALPDREEATSPESPIELQLLVPSRISAESCQNGSVASPASNMEETRLLDRS